MPSGKKKKSSTKKRNVSSKKENGGNKSPISLDDVLSQAETAMEMANIEMALQLFQYAASVLRERVHGDASSNSVDDKRNLTSVLGKTGEIKASMGDVEGARTDFLDAIELMGHSTNSEEMSDEQTDVDNVNSLSTAQQCEHIASLYLYLGQLSSGCEALVSFETGVQQLKKAVTILDRRCKSIRVGQTTDGMDVEEEMSIGELSRYLEETRRQLCSAHCSVAELYLTDLCDEPNAEANCEKELESALKLDKISSKFYTDTCNDGITDDENQLTVPPPDALQTMANLRMSQSRPLDALELIMKAYDRMKTGCEAMAALVGLGKDGEVETNENAKELLEVDAASTLPSYEFRCQTAKLFMEIATVIDGEKKTASGDDDAVTKTCAEVAIQILGSLMAENDEVIEVWYLLGCAFMACSPPQVESAHYYWDKCMTMLLKVKDEMEECLDNSETSEGGMEAIEEQIEEVKTKLKMIDMKDKMDDC